MPLKKCPHCGVQTTDRRADCYYCKKSLFDTPSDVGREPPRTPELITQAPPVITAPISKQENKAEKSPYTIWMSRFFYSLVVLALVYGFKSQGILGYLAGAAIALGLAMLIFPASLLICWIFGASEDKEELAPIISIVAIAFVTAIIAIYGPGKGGIGDCIDSGRYGEYSSC